MNRWLCLLALVAVTGGCAPENLSFLKDKETAYHDSGRYMAQFTSVAQSAQRYLAQAAKQGRPGEKLAVVFDIDETSLSNWPYLQTDDYSVAADLFGKWADQSDCPVLPPTLALYQEARKLGLNVFFVTGRRSILREATERNLARRGYDHYEALYMRPMDYRDVSIIPFKTAARRAITEKGYTIVLNIGDQWSDLAGGYAKRTFKLPNSFYFIR